MVDARARTTHLRWLGEVTALPTAAGREERVIAWVERWVAARQGLSMTRDRAGNLFVSTKEHSSRRTAAPILITAHLDHPAFVVLKASDERSLELEFRGGVHDPYFDGAKLEVIDSQGRAHRASIESLDAAATPFKRVRARLVKRTAAVAPGDIARWAFAGASWPRVARGLLHTHACDDLAAVAAALAAYDELIKRRRSAGVGLLFTRAEEIGFIGAIAACRLGSMPRGARLMCLENSRSFADSPIGAGPIIRVGDRMSVFSPALTNRVSDIVTAHANANPHFKWQRRLMPGGACEATAFAAYGHESTCLCLPLGNYHNMRDIDGVLAGRRPARVGPEFIAIADFHGLVEMLIVACTNLDSAPASSATQRFDDLLQRHGALIGVPNPPA
jgi:endoglucanase